MPDLSGFTKAFDKNFDTEPEPESSTTVLDVLAGLVFLTFCFCIIVLMLAGTAKVLITLF